MSSYAPVGNPFGFPFNPLFPLESLGPDFTSFFGRYRHCGQDPAGNWFPPLDGTPDGQDGSPFSSGGGNGGGGGCDGGNGDSGNGGCGGGGQLSVSGNTVTDGNYKIIATDADHGITVEDTASGKSFQVYGDPYIKTDKGGTANFQHEPVTFKLPDGTEITVTPTNNTGPNSVNTIDHVTITKGNDAVTMTGFKNGDVTTTQHPGQGHWYDQHTDDGTLIRTGRGENFDHLKVSGGPQIYNNGNVGNIDKYADEGGPQSGHGPEIWMLLREIGQLEQFIGQLEQGPFGDGGFGNGGGWNPLLSKF
jgi:hypothetical protein